MSRALLFRVVIYASHLFISPQLVQSFFKLFVLVLPLRLEALDLILQHRYILCKLLISFGGGVLKDLAQTGVLVLPDLGILFLLLGPPDDDVVDQLREPVIPGEHLLLRTGN